MNRDASILACDLRGLSHEKLVILAATLSVEMEKIAQLREHNHASKSWCEYAIGVANDALLNSCLEAVQELSPDYVPVEDAHRASGSQQYSGGRVMYGSDAGHGE